MERCALPSIETPNRAAKEPHRLLRGCRGATLPALARRSHTSNLQTSNIQLVISKLTRFTLNRNVQPRSERISLPLEGMQGHDAPRPRAMAAHLRFCKQAAPRSSQTLHRNTALYLQENAQPRSERISLPLEGMQGRDAPCSRTTVAYLQLQISNIQPRSTLNRNIQPPHRPLKRCREALPALV